MNNCHEKKSQIMFGRIHEKIGLSVMRLTWLLNWKFVNMVKMVFDKASISQNINGSYLFLCLFRLVQMVFGELYFWWLG